MSHKKAIKEPLDVEKAKDLELDEGSLHLLGK
jgi:hypothetical protein